MKPYMFEDFIVLMV